MSDKKIYPENDPRNLVINNTLGRAANSVDPSGRVNELLDYLRRDKETIDAEKAKVLKMLSGDVSALDQEHMDMVMNMSAPLAAATTKFTPALLEKLAQQYKALKNLPDAEVKQALNPRFSRLVGDAYESLTHNPKDTNVRHSYNQLIDQVAEQFDMLKDAGLKTTKLLPGKEGYKNSKEMMFDVAENGRLKYFPTESGFGSDLNNIPIDHPMMNMKNGEVANDQFRIVHDIFGHAKNGNGFGPIGEEEAYQIHKAMLSPDAQKALASETRGQNSWVNFGKHGEANRANPGATIYADQKAGLLPEWAIGNIPQDERGMREVLKQIADARIKGRPLDQAEEHMQNMRAIREMVSRNYSSKGEMVPFLGKGITTKTFEAPGLPNKVIKEKSTGHGRTVREQLIFDKLAKEGLGPKTHGYLTSRGAYQVQDKVTPLKDTIPKYELPDGSTMTNWDQLRHMYGSEVLDTDALIAKKGIQPFDSGVHNSYLDQSDNVVKPFDVDQFKFDHKKKATLDDVVNLNNTLKKPVDLDISSHVGNHVDTDTWTKALQTEDPNYIKELLNHFRKK